MLWPAGTNVKPRSSRNRRATPSLACWPAPAPPTPGARADSLQEGSLAAWESPALASSTRAQSRGRIRSL